jgi:hypothetical protein
MMKVQEPLSSLNHVGIATNASIAMTLQWLVVNTPSTPFAFVLCLKTQTNVMCVNKNYT